MQRPKPSSLVLPVRLVSLQPPRPWPAPPYHRLPPSFPLSHSHSACERSGAFGILSSAFAHLLHPPRRPALLSQTLPPPAAHQVHMPALSATHVISPCLLCLSAIRRL
ncbi:hypothetical protein L226DRAFT_532556 [Lentinus tigrinus ALCF2SS1-7]|uniref:uncharacterized protein n=1 Tax=Lentinus tigrinus ALCF2SS1-7 TaxID=1328758 RepID=UPI001165FFD6|nr:hypothetical protein L226DRAFT_532556 [Lentinus tigrinus ALCF2SS1-7]